MRRTHPASICLLDRLDAGVVSCFAAEGKTHDELESHVEALFNGGRRAWPSVNLTRAELIEGLAVVLNATPQPEATLRSLAADDLYIACACARGSSVAIGAFCGRYFAIVRSTLTAMGLDAGSVEDVQQTVLDRLFNTRPDGPCGVLRYAGRSDLAGLVRVSSVRCALNLLDKRKREVQAQAIADLPDWLDDPALRCLKADSRVAFKRAFEGAVARISGHERDLLRLNMVDGLSVDGIAKIYGVHRATAARWLARARRLVAAHTKQTLRVSSIRKAGDLGEVLDLVRSQLDLSLERVLREDELG